jgi:hypothetical protein
MVRMASGFFAEAGLRRPCCLHYLRRGRFLAALVCIYRAGNPIMLKVPLVNDRLTFVAEAIDVGPRGGAGPRRRRGIAPGNRPR